MEWARRHRWPLAAVAAALLVGGYFAYAATLDVRDASSGEAEKADPQAENGNAQAAAAGTDLSAWLAFEEPKSCAPSAELRALLENMWGRQPGESGATIDVPGSSAPQPIRIERIALEGARNAPVAAQVETPGSWRGLAVRAVRTLSWPESEVRSFQIRFASPPGDVRRALNDAGFELPAPGEQRNDSGGDRAVSIGIEEIAGGAALTCARASAQRASGADTKS
jgi:hypothetical protein